jgi:hypothetical protein
MEDDLIWKIEIIKYDVYLANKSRMDLATTSPGWISPNFEFRQLAQIRGIMTAELATTKLLLITKVSQ